MPINPIFQRLSLLTGKETLDALSNTKVIVFGVGGVGSWCAEALVRSGIGNISVVDSDTVCVTNINRQIQATGRTIGLPKVEVLKNRLTEINPDCTVNAWRNVFSRETASLFGIDEAGYIIDAIDSLTYKLDLIECAFRAGTPLYSSMGMAQKIDPSQIKIADIWNTQGCPLARLVRQGLRKRGFRGHFMTVYSAEQLPLHGEIGTACGSAQCFCPSRKQNAGEDTPIEWCGSKKVINGSAVTVTATAGMFLAGLVIQDIFSRYKQTRNPPVFQKEVFNE